MKRRDFLRALGALPLLSAASSCVAQCDAGGTTATPVRRVRPADPAWPSTASWQRLNRETGGRLIPVRSPLLECSASQDAGACNAAFRQLRNPYFIGDHPGLTQTSGWVDAWTSAPSVYAVAAESTADVVAAVDFAREHDLRVVIKGGGHSYQGTSCAPDSLLIWTRAMNDIRLHDAFVAEGCAGSPAPQPAVTIGAGAVWMQAYAAVTTKASRYVQGGGCATVGVAGLVQSGGFGSFSKAYGLAAAALLEAEVVTADGVARTVNACRHPDLFWGLKGGGGGSLGVVTRLTLRTRELPEFFGAASCTILARSDAAFRQLIARSMRFYAERLFNPHWGEQLVFTSDNHLRVSMLFQGLDEQGAEATWQPFIDEIRAAPRDFVIEQPLRIVAIPARHLWDADFLRRNFPNAIVTDDRPGAPAGNVFWAGDQAQAGQFLHAYRSAWLPATLLAASRREVLADALFACTRHWDVSLHFNKGLAGAPPAERAAARDTAINPAALDAFALAIIGAEGPPAYPGVAGHEPDLAAARSARRETDRAIEKLLAVAGKTGSYLAESDYFERDWQRAFWGENYPRLAAVKKRYDPGGLFFVHHGVGSEEWSADGFTRLGGAPSPGSRTR